MSDEPGRECFVIDGDHPHLAKLWVIEVTDGRPGYFNGWAGLTDSNVAFKSVNVQEPGDDAGELADFAGSVFMPWADNAGYNNVAFIDR